MSDMSGSALLWLGVVFAAVSCLVSLIVLRRLSLMAGQGEADQLARLCVMMERETAARVAENEAQRARMADIERALSARLDQRHQEMTETFNRIARMMGRDLADMRVTQSESLREMAEEGRRQSDELRAAVNERLHQAVEKQMQTSFQRVLEQIAAMQKAMGEVSAMTAQVGDLKRLFSNVKTRGGWGEAQLRSILDDVLPEGAYETNRRLRDDSREVVEFAVRMPVRATVPPVLAIDSKFPTEAYERLLQAVEDCNPDAERAARRALETTLRIEARKIATKYIVPPVTVEFAVLYLPTDGLYAEVARIPGLLDEIGRTYRVIVMGPGLMPAMLRTIHLGYVTLALERRTDDIARLLGATRQEMLRMDGVLEKLARNASAMSSSIDEARRRTGLVTRRLRELDVDTHAAPAGDDGFPLPPAMDDGGGAQADMAPTWSREGVGGMGRS
ncbi:DNA recombination protein RmuC [Komagataeibacter intermedius]|uniref:DNA recombination protein RmuC homolog n=2 Tax=Komagataeibacter intermedius TaxID=66229 RepID=A0A0N0MGS6_9PROT|nr:DNA recombination protein RmuC [Komagataeibacter intermedius]KPH89113.1 DNA polymerase [Komagataeibacter intermedius AF2]MCF3635180.1 DNA recombination protein RmuC [Komagataeibacter intermedius]GAN87394.1 DNA recombinase RmuC [Komagataeibacter intermedius TF2]GBQ73236.1 DNA recombinase RmuC [Komagataeibacter intermedius NRIC 0521]